MAMHLDRSPEEYYKHLLELLVTNKELEKTIRGILTLTAWTVGGAVAGGVVAGPPGALVGAATGFVLGCFTSDPYGVMLGAVRNLPNADRAQLVASVQELVGSSSMEDLDDYIRSKEQREALAKTILPMLKKK